MFQYLKNLHKHSKIQHFFATFFISIFTVIGVFGVYACAGAAMDMGEKVMPSAEDHAHHGAIQTDCLLNAEQESCGVNILDHVAHWFGTFVFSPVLNVLVLLAFAVVFLFFSSFKKPHHIASFSLGLERYKLYRAGHPNSALYNYFLTFFSKGILHPKIYS